MQQMEARGDWDWAMETTSRQVGSGTTSTDLVWSVWSQDFVLWAGQLPGVGGVWALGSVLAIRIASTDGTEGYKSGAARAVQAALLQGHRADEEVNEPQWNVHSRVLGNCLYVMAGQKTTREGVQGVEGLLRGALLEAS
jgi:dethiobiotin synthetase/adenosylmethionine--8-amino-7-oxononanoate aminotransferase